MHNDTIKAANKIINDKDLTEEKEKGVYKEPNVTHDDFLTKLNNNDDYNKIVETIDLINIEMHSKQLEVPIIEGLKIYESVHPKLILTAGNDNIIQQFSGDGTLKVGESFDSRIHKVNNDVINFIKSQGVGFDCSISFFEEYKTDVFHFKIYLQDALINQDGKIRLIRQFSAFFIEPNFNDFYQLSVSCPPINYPHENIEIGKAYIENDMISKYLYNELKFLLDTIKYRNFEAENENDIEKETRDNVNSEFECDGIPEIINNEFDFSNVVPSIDKILHLVQYCDDIYSKFLQLTEEDEKRNEKLKIDYQVWDFQKCYGNSFEIDIKDKKFNRLTCKNLREFKDAINNGYVKNIGDLRIKLNLDYKAGTYSDLTSHENSFEIIFKPYDIKFVRKSNFNEKLMNDVENNINVILEGFQAINTIFCTK